MRVLRLLVLVASAACKTSALQQPSDDDLLNVARLGLATAGAGENFVLVVAPDYPSETRAVLAQLGDVIAPAEVPQSADASLPAGHFIVDRLEVTGDTAIFAGRKGPIPKAKPGVILLDCGTGYNVPMKKQPDGTWTVATFSLSAC